VSKFLALPAAWPWPHSAWSAWRGRLGDHDTDRVDAAAGHGLRHRGHSCGGIQETSAATGFDPTTGFPTGQVGLSTRCGGSGKGGGGGSTTYTGSADVTWDFTGAVVAYTVPATGSAVPGFSATDADGNQVYDSAIPHCCCWPPGSPAAPGHRRLSGRGSLVGGTPVTITGTGFTGATQVSFGPTPAAAFTVVDDTSITATAPTLRRGRSTSP